jgi:Transcriptional regulator
MVKFNNDRTINTKNRINKVFIDLMKEKGFLKVTVGDIIERAGINRSTFYAYYLDKYDLLEKAEDRFLVGLREIEDVASFDIPLKNSNSDSSLAQLERYIRYMYENGELFMSFSLDREIGSEFMNKVNNAIRTLWLDKHLLDRLSLPQNYAQAVLVNMANGLIYEWVKSDLRETPEEFMKIYNQTINNVLIGIIS